MIDLTAAYKKIGGVFQRGLMNRVMRQQSIDGGRYSPPKPSTGGSRKVQRLKKGTGTIGGVPTTWGGKAKSFRRLYVTGNFAKGAFNYSADADGVWIFASENMHPGGATYADIVRYNSRNFSEVNPNINPPTPILFPQTQAEIMKMTDEIDFARHELKSELIIQFTKLIPPRVEIVIG